MIEMVVRDQDADQLQFVSVEVSFYGTGIAWIDNNGSGVVVKTPDIVVCKSGDWVNLHKAFRPMCRLLWIILDYFRAEIIMAAEQTQTPKGKLWQCGVNSRRRHCGYPS